MIAFIDIDGTLANNDHRQHFIEKAKRLWDYFYAPENLVKDTPIPEAVAALPKLLKESGQFVFLTGRPEYTRMATAEWLMRHFNIPTVDPEAWGKEHYRPSTYPLYMRKNKDWRKASIYKGARVDKILSTVAPTPKEEIIFFDDDLRNEEMYRQRGVFLKAPECWLDM